jgi:predicted GNAT family acetyltransferase
MVYTEHKSAETFLAVARPTLEIRESVNGLMIGVALRLVGEPTAYGDEPFLATVESAGSLRLAAVMTPPYKLQVHLEDAGDIAALELLAQGLIRGKWCIPGIIAHDTVAEAFAALWSGKTGVSCQSGMRQGVYELRRVVLPAYPTGEFRQVSAEDLEIVRRWARGFHDDCFGDDRYQQSIAEADAKVKSGSLFFWVDGKPVSMAARTRPTPHGEAISFVYTPPEHRRKGYASAVVASLSQMILGEGKQFCTLYTDLSNATSNSVYRRIGYTKVADVLDIFFEVGADKPGSPPNS